MNDRMLQDVQAGKDFSSWLQMGSGNKTVTEIPSSYIQ